MIIYTSYIIKSSHVFYSYHFLDTNKILMSRGMPEMSGFFPSYHAILPAIRVKEPCTRQVMMADNLKLYWLVICRNAHIYDYMYIMDWKVIVFTICYNFIVQIYNDIYSVYISYKGTVQIYIYIKCLENYLLSLSINCL